LRSFICVNTPKSLVACVKDKCTLFKSDSGLAGGPSVRNSLVRVKVFLLNLFGLSLLRFEAFAARLSTFRSSIDSETEARIAALDGRATLQDQWVVDQQAEIAQLSSQIRSIRVASAPK
jgi:hypothetical protein